MDASFKIIVKTLAGLEEVLATELRELGIEDVEPSRRAVFCTGNLETIYKINMRCRTALKVLKPILEFTADTTDKVYHAVRAIDWEEHMDLNQTFAIDAVTFSEKFHHSKFVALRTKDAIADFFSKKYNKRPNVSVTNPQLMVNLHIADTKCTLSLDSSGESLHKRGWRDAQTEAPINEVLAAGILLLSGWKGQCDFYDPMCGSGTFLIEATMIAKGIAPGLYRNGFAFEKWKDFDSELFEEIYNDDSIEKDFAHKIYGSDASEMALTIAERNIKSAGLTKAIELKQMQFQELEATDTKGMIVMNPPYGERLKPDLLIELYENIGERLKHTLTGYDTWIISHKQECFNAIGLRPSDKINLMNGKLKCQLRHYETYEGSKKGERREVPEESLNAEQGAQIAEPIEPQEPKEKREPLKVNLDNKRTDRPEKRESDDRAPRKERDRGPRRDDRGAPGRNDRRGDRRPDDRRRDDRRDGARPERLNRPGRDFGDKPRDEEVSKKKPSKKDEIEKLRKALNIQKPKNKTKKPKRPRI